MTVLLPYYNPSSLLNVCAALPLCAYTCAGCAACGVWRLQTFALWLRSAYLRTGMISQRFTFSIPVFLFCALPTTYTHAFAHTRAYAFCFYRTVRCTHILPYGARCPRVHFLLIKLFVPSAFVVRIPEFYGSCGWLVVCVRCVLGWTVSKRAF